MLFLHRLDWGPVAIAMLLRVVSLALVLRWRVVGGDWRLIAAAFLVGVGSLRQGDLRVVRRRARARRARDVALVARPPAAAIVGGVMALLIGAAPLVAFNVRIRSRRSRTTSSSADEPLLQQMTDRVRLMAHTLSGADLYFFVNGQPLPGRCRVRDCRRGSRTSSAGRSRSPARGCRS